MPQKSYRFTLTSNTISDVPLANGVAPKCYIFKNSCNSALPIDYISFLLAGGAPIVSNIYQNNPKTTCVHVFVRSNFMLCALDVSWAHMNFSWRRAAEPDGSLAILHCIALEVVSQEKSYTLGSFYRFNTLDPNPLILGESDPEISVKFWKVALKFTGAF